ncbi:MAG TPA: hypothetical protein VFS20_00360 [Longimicrobium sp.]|nr:hypothetical protein [Longimicrobium sp.]
MYEHPEILEMGAAADLTLGMDGDTSDRCGCCQPKSQVGEE